MSSVFGGVGRNGLPCSGEVAPALLRLSDTGAVTTLYGPFGNFGGSGLIVNVNATAAANTPSVVFTVQGYDPVSDTWYDLLASAAVTAAAVKTLQVHPALTAVTNLAASALVPDQWRVKAVAGAGATKSLTYSISGTLTP